MMISAIVFLGVRVCIQSQMRGTFTQFKHYNLQDHDLYQEAARDSATFKGNCKKLTALVVSRLFKLKTKNVSRFQIILKNKAFSAKFKKKKKAQSPLT